MYSKNFFIVDQNHLHSHASSIYFHKNILYCTWYSYPEHEHEDAEIFISQTKDLGRNWSKPISIFKDDSFSLGNPILFESNRDLYIMFTKIPKGYYWNNASTFMSKYDLIKESWESPSKISVPTAIIPRHKPLLISGKLIFPFYNEESMKSTFYETLDLKTWNKVYESEEKIIQGELLQTSELELQCFYRSANNNKFIYKTISPNLGNSWSKSIQTNLNCPLSGIAAANNDKEIIIINNNTLEHKRNPLTIYISLDNGVSFNECYILEKDNLEFSYPSVFLYKNETLFISYTYNRKFIKFVCLEMKELRNGIR